MSTAAKSLFRELSISCKDCGLGELCIPRDLDQVDIDKLDDSVSHTLLLQTGDVLYKQGMPFKSLYAVKSGSVKISTKGSKGKSEMGIYLPGEIIGFDGLSSDKYQCSISALETSSICEIYLDDLQQSIPSIFRQLLKHASKILNQSTTLYSGNKQSAEKRIVLFLLDISRRYKQRGYVHTQFNLLLTRSQLGNLLDLTPETVSRGLRKLERDGLINIQNQRRVHINDMAGLEQLVENHE
ncbi:MAG: Fnr-like negative transcriptional regulator of CydAB [Piscirickettsiaceae bacterium]|nr:MAG: Fnr-like negative transcriptional regulator of CydAB [Piscirickettsiaceae bacterium]PCI71927.1 MAG: Fnr-like negative transcriptional regulator of CydAB [Piscirickettsiaceae bacterium]